MFRGGARWWGYAALLAASAAPWVPLARATDGYLDCERRWGSGPQCGQLVPGALSAAGAALLAVLVGVTVGLSWGGSRGNRRMPFTSVGSRGRAVVLAATVAVLAPAFAAGYAIGYRIGRWRPPRREDPGAVYTRTLARQHQQGWDRARELHRQLAAGRALPTREPGDVMLPGRIHLDAGMQYGRYYGKRLDYRPLSLFVWGSAGRVATSMLLNMAADRAILRRARADAMKQWRDWCWSRVVVTERSTWCRTGFGEWLEFTHDAVLEYRVEGWAVVMTFHGTYPLMLAGPDAWMHAVLFARLRLGPAHWQDAPWLRPFTSRLLADELMAIVQSCRPPGTPPA